MTASSFSVEGKNIVVTGGTRGIGRAVTLAFSRAGAVVLANYVRGQQAADELTALAAQEGLRVRLCRADLTSDKGLEQLDEAVRGLDGPVHGLLHCAATGVHKPITELTLRHFDWTFALNTRAFFEIVRRMLPHFAPEASVVAVSSQGALRAVPAYSVIGASKGALEALARHMAVELAPRGIRVNIISPGAIETEAWQVMPDGPARLEDLTKKTPIGRLVDAGEVAQVAVFLCTSAARSMVGQTLVVDGGAGIPV